MSKNTPKLEINDEAYDRYVANELGLEEVMDLGHLEAEDRLKLELMVENAKMGVDSLPDDPTVRAAVNALLCEQRGHLTDDTVDTVLVNTDEKIDVETVTKTEKALSSEQTEKLLNKLEARFNANKKRHKGVEWSKVQIGINEAAPEKLWKLNEMEITGGEPDVVGYIEETGEYEFWDFSKESPKGRRNICSDREGQEEAEKRGDTPKGNAVDMAEAMGLGGLLNEDQYRKLQKLGKFDKNTYSWIDTPKEIREKGVALGADRDRGAVDVGGDLPDRHDVSVGFRGWLRV